MSDAITIALYILASLALVCIIQLLLLILANSSNCPRAVHFALSFLLILPAAGLVALIPCILLSKPSGFLDLRGVAALLCLTAALIVLAGWGLGFGIRALYRRFRKG